MIRITQQLRCLQKKARHKENFAMAFENYHTDDRKFKDPKFKVGDKVRISKYKRKIFDKGFTPNWTEEVFFINEILPTKPVTYKIRDYNGEVIEGSFYEQELQKTNQDTFRIEKILKKKGKKAYVKFKGYSNDFNSWVNLY